MSIKESLLNSCLHDLTICQHIHTKFEPKNANWRPRENMRSTLELMQYLSYIGKALTRHFVNPPEDRAQARDGYIAASKWSGEAVTFANFTEMIEREKEEIRQLLSALTDADLQRITYHPFSQAESTLFDALLTVGKYVCAYRHQLFLYAKMCGATVNTRNNWYGMDPAPAPATKAA
jgi:hypothetical protein